MTTHKKEELRDLMFNLHQVDVTAVHMDTGETFEFIFTDFEEAVAEIEVLENDHDVYF